MKIKRIIFCVVSLVLILTALCLQTFAFGMDGTSVLQPHPYTPNAVTYYESYYDANYTLDTLTTFPVDGATSTAISCIYNINEHVEINSMTEKLTTPYNGKSYYNSTSINGDVTTVYIEWSQFTIPNDFTVFSSYFPYIEYKTYADSTFMLNFDLEMEDGNHYDDTAWITATSTANVGAEVVNFLRNNTVQGGENVVRSLSVSVTPQNSKLSSLRIYYDVITEHTNVNTLIPEPQMIIPENVDAQGLLGWLSPALRGFLNTPLFPITTEYSFTIGSGVALTLGVGLLFAFLRFFSGG